MAGPPGEKQWRHVAWPFTIGLVAVLALAATVRLVGIGWGNPYVYHPDEGFVLGPAMNMARTGDWNPHLFLYPSGLIDAASLLVSLIHGLTGISIDTSRTISLASMADRGPSDFLPEQFVYDLAGRIFVAVLGVLSVALVAVAARQLTGSAGAIASALFLAVTPLAAINAHYLTTDVPASFAVALCICLTARAVPGRTRWYVAAGAAAGLAAGFKYNGGYIVVLPLATYLIARWQLRSVATWTSLRTVGLVVVAAGLTFVVTTPAVLFDFSSVLAAIHEQVIQYSGHPGAEGANNWVHYLNYLFGTQRLLMVLACLGMVIALFRRRPVELALLAATLAYFVIISVPVTRYERNLIPLLPGLAIFAGIPIGLAANRVRSWQPRSLAVGGAMIPSVVTAFAIVQPLGLVLDRDRQFLLPDTRTVALEWAETNLPAGAAVVREEFTPQLPATRFRSGWVFLLANTPLATLRELGVQYLIVSSFQFDRYAGYPVEQAYYEAVLSMPVLLDVEPDAQSAGPRVIIVRLPS